MNNFRYFSNVYRKDQHLVDCQLSSDFATKIGELFRKWFSKSWKTDPLQLGVRTNIALLFAVAESATAIAVVGEASGSNRVDRPATASNKSFLKFR